MAKRWRRRRAEGGDPAMPTVEGYEDLTVIGRGASATVYRAAQAAYDRHVAIKVFQIGISDRRAQRRFNRERSASGRLSHHPNVVTVLDSGLIDGRHPYLTMELFEDGSLADALETHGAFGIDQALHISIRVAGALESAHRLGVLHRDIKPQNILLSRFDEPALADFGIAAILEAEPVLTAALTPSHAAPELLEGAEPTPQSDVYALTSSIYTLVAGTPPFAGVEGEGILAQLLRVTNNDVPAIPRADMPPSLQHLLRRGLAKRPDDRPASAMELGIGLQRIQAELGLAETSLPVDSSSPDHPPPSGEIEWGEPPAADVDLDRPLPAEAEWGQPSIAAADADQGLPAESGWGPPFDSGTIEPPGNPVRVAGLTPGSGRIDPPSRPGDAVRVRLEGDGDPTVGVPPRSPTVVGRQAVVKRPLAAKPARRWPRVAASVAAVVVGAAGVYGGSVLIAGRGGDDTSASANSVPADQLTDEELQALAPTGIDAVADADGDGIVVRWTDESDGRYNFVVRATMNDGSAGLPVTAERDSAAAKLDVDPSQVDCITVSALVALGEPPVLAESSPFCL